MSETIQVGAKLPDATLRLMTAEGPTAKSTLELFGGKKVALFAVPGAFTPTCNNTHLPSYLENAGALKEKGVDEIACVAINDVFVMDAWGKANSVGSKITLLSDGNGEFSSAIGMTFDGSGHGLGTRSLRYSMIVEDGTVSAMHVEENPGACEITSGAQILADLA